MVWAFDPRKLIEEAKENAAEIKEKNTDGQKFFIVPKTKYNIFENFSKTK